jgi:hypothetical protein
MINSIYEIKDKSKHNFFILNIDKKLYYTPKWCSFYNYNEKEILYHLSKNIEYVFKNEIIKSKKVSILDLLKTLGPYDFSNFKYILFYDQAFCLYKFNIKKYLLTQKIKKLND